MQLFNYRKDWVAAIDTSPNGTDASRPFNQWASDPEWPINTFGLTYPQEGAPSSIAFLGSHCSTPLGEINDPASTSYTYAGDLVASTTAIVENLPSGFGNWGTFYSGGMVVASKFFISIQAPYTQLQYKYVLVPYVNFGVSATNTTYTGPMTLSRPNYSNTTAPTTKIILDNLTYEEASSLPGARFGFIKSANNGPTRITLPWISTKKMLSYRDIMDNEENLEMNMPQVTTSDETPEVFTLNSTNSQALGAASRADSYIYYFRVYSNIIDTRDPDYNQNTLTFMVRIKYRVLMYDRKPFAQLIAGAAS